MVVVVLLPLVVGTTVGSFMVEYGSLDETKTLLVLTFLMKWVCLFFIDCLPITFHIFILKNKFWYKNDDLRYKDLTLNISGTISGSKACKHVLILLNTCFFTL